MSSKMRMRPVTAGPAAKRSYNRALDAADAADPFTSMYSQAYGGRQSSKLQQKENQQSARYGTPQKQQKKSRNDNDQIAKIARVASKFDKADSEKRYAAFKRADSAVTAQTMQSQLSNTIGGYQGGRKTRCTDKFVRYPYPKSMGSGYQKDFQEKLKNTVVMKPKEAFNLEKEAKIINPHMMETSTTNKNNFKTFKCEPKKKKLRVAEIEDKPILGQSSYAKAFPNWRNGQNDIFHEKHPQYPYYSLPFKGESSYKQSFTEEQQRKLRQHNEMLKQIGQQGASSMIGLSQYKPHRFESETTNQKAYQSFKLQSRPKVQTQKVGAVLSKAMPSHFDTFNQRELVQHSLKVSELDLIPYP